MPDTKGDTRIGAYRLVRRLGAGGMGEVFLAWDDRLERPVAVKRLRRDGAGGMARRERLRREARAAARLSHPNVVQIFDLVEAEEDGDSIVLEYIQGRPLAEVLPVPPAAAVELARQVADGLAAAHAQGLVHRDLKAENVMVTPAGQAKILDFGLARPLAAGTGETLTEDGAVLGTYRSMSPEQAKGETADARSDLFSLGVLLYEMLAGRSPFQGKTPLETLQNVTGGAAPSLVDLPAELAALVQSLLEKDPSRRPPSAAAVSQRLREIAALPALASAPGWTPFAPDPSDAGMDPTRTLLAERPLDLGTSALRTASWLRGRGVRLALALTLAVALAAAVSWNRWALAPREPLRVAVLKPVVGGDGGEEVELAAAGVLVGTLRTLLSLEGIEPVDSAQIGSFDGGTVEVARALAADEVLTAALTGGRKAATVSFQRIRVDDGSVLWAESIQVPTTPGDTMILANGVGAAVRRAYAGQRVREGAPDLEARGADYAEFLRIKQRLDSGRSAWAPELDHLDAVVAESPRFVDAHLLAATIALNLYENTRKTDFLSRARASLERAQALAPDAPETLGVAIRLATTEADWTQADQLLDRLAARVPGDPLVALQRAQIASRRGRKAEAIAVLRPLVERRPAWRDLLFLGELEFTSGEVEPARRHLGQALELMPGNTWALAKLGELELLYGDLQRARGIYQELVRNGPQRSDLTNLGLVHFLLGDSAQAAAEYRRALALDPGHVIVTLNLADAELALGHREEAHRLYRQVLASLRDKERSAPLTAGERTIEAQCLAQLGEGQKAVEIVLDTLQRNPEDVEVIYQSALVYALTGERTSALALTRKALDRGTQARWFNIPGFAALREDPVFRALLADGSGPHPPAPSPSRPPHPPTPSPETGEGEKDQD